MASSDMLAVNTIRLLSADQVQAANSGHPGMPMGMAPVAHVLFTRHLKFDSTNAKWLNRDRWLLSNGHGSALQYSMLHLAGYKVTIEDLKMFRQLHSKTPGHPESHMTEGVEVTTGPLGQGIANGVGLAIAEANMAARYNKQNFTLFDNYTYVFAGDGCMQEGIASEAASLAGHLGLGKLIVIYDDNHVQIDGHTELTFTEDVAKRFEAYGWSTHRVADGDNDLAGIDQAIQQAKSVHDRPSLILLRTTIGFGAAKQGTEAVHGAALGIDDLRHVKSKFGFDPEKSFYIPSEVRQIYQEVAGRGVVLRKNWDQLLQKYEQQFPAEFQELQHRLNGSFPEGWKAKFATYKPGDKADATRNLSNVALHVVAANFPGLIGGSADLAGSNKTNIKGWIDFQKNTPHGRCLHFGVREHAMAAIGNGLSAYGGFIPYSATFLNFIEYCFPAVRLSALSHVQQLYITTHDSIGLGEDGPTHQPIEAMALVRSTPGVLDFRPADGNETVGSYISALEYKNGPSVFALSRQNLPQLHGSNALQVARGAYILQDTNGTPDIILIATGSEVSLAVEVAKILSDQKVRVVSAPSHQLFDRQPVEYRRSVLTPGVPTVAIEMLSTYGWQKYSHVVLGMTTFGTSAPDKKCFELFRFTAPQTAEDVRTRVAALRAEIKLLTGKDTVSALPTHFSYNNLPSL